MTQKIKISIYLMVGFGLLSACTKKFTELNTTHNATTVTSIPPLMNSVIGTLVLNWTEQASMHNDYYYECTQLAAETSVSGYVLENGINGIWADYYSALQNMRLIQQYINAKPDQQAESNVQAILYILRAYKTFRITDQFGDIPYFKAGYAYLNDAADYHPAYDAQQVIYDSLMTDLTWAVKNINTNTSPMTSAGNHYDSLGIYDTFFGGDMSMWLKFANSLRLRYAMQMVEKDPATATPIIADAISGSAPLIGAGEDVGIWPTRLGGLDLAGRWWSFSSGGTGFVRISSTMWNLVADGTNPSQIFDPRAWLFTETNGSGKFNPYTIGVSTGDAVNAYQSATDSSLKNNCIYSPFNWFLVRDEYYIPEVIMSEAEVHFLKAEAYARGLGVTQSLTTANTEYQAGITSSVNFWYNVADNTNNTTAQWAPVAPPTPTTTQMNTLLANPKVAFTGSASDAVTKIYAQEWLSFFRQPWLAYNLWRRTSNTPMDPAAQPSAALTNFFRLTYPQDESVNNKDNFEAQLTKMGGQNISTTKVWWQP